MYVSSFTKHFEKVFSKISQKNTQLHLIASKKMIEILQNPLRYKPLRGDLKGYFRVHLDSHFVLLFRIVESEKMVVFEDISHHDFAYRKK